MILSPRLKYSNQYFTNESNLEHSGKWDFEDYCSNKGLIKNRSAYFCPQPPVRLN